jgi:PII-like signaling protein
MALQTHTSNRIIGKLLESSARGIFSSILTKQQLNGDLASMVKACVHETGKKIPGLSGWLNTDYDAKDGLWDQLQENFNNIPLDRNIVEEMLKLAIKGEVILQGMSGHTIASPQQKAIIDAVIDTLTYTDNADGNNPHQVQQVNIKEVRLQQLLSFAKKNAITWRLQNICWKNLKKRKLL